MRALKILTAVGLVVFLLVILVPFWWIASMSFKTYEQIQFATSIYVPKPFTWENYSGLWTETRFPLWLQNSLVTALVVTVTTTVIASLGGYAVARIKFPGREAIASLILILYLIPPALLFIPLYRVLAELGATNHLSALFLSYPTFTVPFCTWLLIGFFKALPEELEEAALIDGAGRITAFVRVLLPLAAPGLVASAIFAFTLSWNEFLYALVFIHRWMVEGLVAGIGEGLKDHGAALLELFPRSTRMPEPRVRGTLVVATRRNTDAAPQDRDSRAR